MKTLVVKTVEDVSANMVISAMQTLDIDATLELEGAHSGAHYDFAELTDEYGKVLWSTDGPKAQVARKFFDEVWS